MKTVCEILMRAPTSAALQYYVCLGVPEQAAQLRSRREDRRKPVAVIRSAKLVAGSLKPRSSDRSLPA